MVFIVGMGVGDIVADFVSVSIQALEKAKEAGRKERTLVRQREQSGNADINVDLTYSVSKAVVYQWLLVSGND